MVIVPCLYEFHSGSLVRSRFPFADPQTQTETLRLGRAATIVMCLFHDS